MAGVAHARLCSVLRGMLSSGAETDAALAAARRKAVAVAGSIDDPEAAAAAALHAFVGTTVGTLALARDWTSGELQGLVDGVAAELGVDRSVAEQEIFRRALERVEEVGLPGRLALRAALTLLVAFGPVGEASVWASEAGSPSCLALVGAERPSRRVRAAARETLSTGRDRITERGLVNSVALSRWDRPLGALVLRSRSAHRPRVLARANEAMRLLIASLERASLLTRNAVRERTLLEATERRVCRLGYDIHDGPLQEIAMLAGDVRLLHRQLERGLLQEAPSSVILGRLDDFDSRLVALDRELRELALSLNRPSVGDVPLAEALRRQIAAVRTRSALAIRLDVRGGDEITASQRLALLALVGEGLANVREHSKATHARVRVFVGKHRTIASIEDDGRGFDVGRTLARAARRGRLGLVGLGERIRLLGGSLTVDSRPGGPTRLTVVLPRWDEDARDRDTVRAA
jgi:signal transduction histidine kinase